MKKRCTHIERCFMSAALLCSCTWFSMQAQTVQTPASAQPDKTVVPGPQYKKSGFHQWLWGRHYRKEWTTPARFPVLKLDTAFGGLTPYQEGGSSQTRSLRLRTADNKEFVLRSVDKSYTIGLPGIYKNTFIEDIANDQVSSMHPYAALTITPMADAAGILHTQPAIYFVPKQPALGDFNEKFGDKLYVIEQRPDGNWQEASNFANSEKIISTEKLLEKLLQDNSVEVDQQLFVRARLFDMVIGDWSRREDQWRWALTEQDGKIIYKPVPRDRDQAYAKFDGFLLRVALSVAGLSHIESFRGEIDDIETFNYAARNLDRRMTNECDLQVWTSNAKELQAALTDEVIENAVKQMPPEAFPVSGERLIANLKSRRDNLPEFAADYYKFLSKEVDVPGTEQPEHFEVTRLSENEMKLSIYKMQNSGTRESNPFYERTFTEDVTKELRIYGIAGNDSYNVNGEAKNDIDLLIIGGKDKDVITDASGARNETHIYDDHNNTITTARRTRLHLSNDDSVHNYKYDAYNYSKRGFKPSLFFSNYDRFHAGLGYTITKEAWRREPFAYQHSVYARYSITQNAMSFGYQGILNQFIGKWDLLLNAEYDAIRWTNYYGIGNETTQDTKLDRDFYRIRSREMYAGVSLSRKLGSTSNLRFTPFYQGTRILNDEGRLHTTPVSGISTRNVPVNEPSFEWDHYAGAALTFAYVDVDNITVPKKGITFSTGLAHTLSLQESDRHVNSVTGTFNFYLPLGKQLVLAVRNGGATLTGQPKVYQLNMIGGSQNLRGYRRDRFRGHSAVYNNNELQWHFNVRSKIFNGTAGPVVFYDIGRVWEPDENSKQWHSGYGAGIMIAPFNKVNASITYGLSKESGVLHLRLVRAF
jgi:Omp85 superfamily domain